MDKALGKVNPNPLATCLDKPTDNLEELSSRSEADIQSLTVAFGIWSVGTILNPAYSFVVLLTATSTGDKQGKTTIITGFLEHFNGDGMQF